MKTKICSSCKEEKTIDNFGVCKRMKDGMDYYCKKCHRDRNLKRYYLDIDASRKKSREAMARYVEKNPDKHNERVAKYNKEYYEKNMKQESERHKRNYRKNIEEYKKRDKTRRALPEERKKSNDRIKKYRQERRATDRNYDIKVRLSASIKTGFSNKKTPKNGLSVDLLGCGFNFAVQYLDSLGYDKEIHDIDHIIPISRFNLTDDYHKHIAFNYRNIQPMIKSENRSKGNSLINGWEKILIDICNAISIEPEPIIEYVKSTIKEVAA